MDLTVIPTFRCNSRCQMCYIWKNPTEPKLEVTAETLAKLPGGFDNLNLSVATALAARTTRFQPLIAIRPGFWRPAHFANAAATLDRISPCQLVGVIEAMWELNLSPSFREDEGRFGAFGAMAGALPSPRETIGLQVRAIAGHDTSARLGGLEPPTLVLHGSEDRVLGVANGRLIASLIPARLELLEGIGHMFWWEQPERSAALVRDHALAPA